MLARRKTNIGLISTSLLGIVLAATPGAARADWIVETIDSEGDVGTYTSLAVDADGNPHVAYYDQSLARVKYAKRVAGLWQAESISDLPGCFPALALDTQGRPHISWNRWAWHAEPVMYTHWDGSQWLTQELPYGVCPGRNNHTSLALTSAGVPHLAAVPTGAETWTDQLWYVTWNGSAWSGTQLTTGGAESGRATITLDTNDHPRIVWPCYYGGPAYLQYFWSDGSGWSSEWISDAVLPGSVWEPAAFALETDGTPQVTFLNTAWALMHGRRVGGAWQFDQVLSTVVHSWNALGLDANGSPHIACYDNTHLRYARQTSGAWCAQKAIAGVYYYPSIAIDPNGNPHIAYYDTVNQDLKHAWWDSSVYSGDMNCSGCVGFEDINPFVKYVSNLDAWQAAYPGCPAENGDIDGDGLHAGNGYPFDDINAFVRLLSGV